MLVESIVLHQNYLEEQAGTQVDDEVGIGWLTDSLIDQKQLSMHVMT